MPKIQPITPSRYRDCRWKRYQSYAFAAQQAVAPILAQEVSKAVMSLPLAFIEDQGAMQLVAVQSLEPNRNLFVAPDGRWLGSYVPAAFRGFPFTLMKTEQGQQVLCFDEDSGLLLQHPTPGDGEPFFDADGEPSEPIRQVLEFLSQVDANRAVTNRLCQQIADAELLQPWPLKVTTAEGERLVKGLFCIHEPAFNALPLDRLDQLRQSGALTLILCQLLSMQHMQPLIRMAEQQAVTQTSVPAGGSGLSDDSESLHFDWDAKSPST
ncbi:MAG: peptidase [Halochromatium sp.]|nr:peptidase [Halochromatium sp.]